MKEFKCICGCGEMRRFLSPFVWRNKEEVLEVVINASGLICDNCGAVAIDFPEGLRIQRALQIVLEEGPQKEGNTLA